MMAFIKSMFCSCDQHKKKLKAAHEQDRAVRESLTEGQIDKGLKDTMEASDPVAKY